MKKNMIENKMNKKLSERLGRLYWQKYFIGRIPHDSDFMGLYSEREDNDKISFEMKLEQIEIKKKLILFSKFIKSDFIYKNNIKENVEKNYLLKLKNYDWIQIYTDRKVRAVNKYSFYYKLHTFRLILNWKKWINTSKKYFLKNGVYFKQIRLLERNLNYIFRYYCLRVLFKFLKVNFWSKINIKKYYVSVQKSDDCIVRGNLITGFLNNTHVSNLHDNYYLIHNSFILQSSIYKLLPLFIIFPNRTFSWYNFQNVFYQGRNNLFRIARSLNSSSFGHWLSYVSRQGLVNKTTSLKYKYYNQFNSQENLLSRIWLGSIVNMIPQSKKIVAIIWSIRSQILFRIGLPVFHIDRLTRNNYYFVFYEQEEDCILELMACFLVSYFKQLQYLRLSLNISKDKKISFYKDILRGFYKIFTNQEINNNCVIIREDKFKTVVYQYSLLFLPFQFTRKKFKKLNLLLNYFFFDNSIIKNFKIFFFSFNKQKGYYKDFFFINNRYNIYCKHNVRKKYHYFNTMKQYLIYCNYICTYIYEQQFRVESLFSFKIFFLQMFYDKSKIFVTGFINLFLIKKFKVRKKKILFLYILKKIIKGVIIKTFSNINVVRELNIGKNGVIIKKNISELVDYNSYNNFFWGLEKNKLIVQKKIIKWLFSYEKIFIKNKSEFYSISNIGSFVKLGDYNKKLSYIKNILIKSYLGTIHYYKGYLNNSITERNGFKNLENINSQKIKSYFFKDSRFNFIKQGKWLKFVTKKIFLIVRPFNFKTWIDSVFRKVLLKSSYNYFFSYKHFSIKLVTQILKFLFLKNNFRGILGIQKFTPYSSNFSIVQQYNFGKIKNIFLKRLYKKSGILIVLKFFKKWDFSESIVDFRIKYFKIRFIQRKFLLQKYYNNTSVVKDFWWLKNVKTLYINFFIVYSKLMSYGGIFIKLKIKKRVLQTNFTKTVVNIRRKVPLVYIFKKKYKTEYYQKFIIYKNKNDLNFIDKNSYSIFLQNFKKWYLNCKFYNLKFIYSNIKIDRKLYFNNNFNVQFLKDFKKPFNVSFDKKISGDSFYINNISVYWFKFKILIKKFFFNHTALVSKLIQIKKMGVINIFTVKLNYVFISKLTKFFLGHKIRVVRFGKFKKKIDIFIKDIIINKVFWKLLDYNIIVLNQHNTNNLRYTNLKILNRQKFVYLKKLSLFNIGIFIKKDFFYKIFLQNLFKWEKKSFRLFLFRQLKYLKISIFKFIVKLYNYLTVLCNKLSIKEIKRLKYLLKIKKVHFRGYYIDTLLIKYYGFKGFKDINLRRSKLKNKYVYFYNLNSLRQYYLLKNMSKRYYKKIIYQKKYYMRNVYIYKFVSKNFITKVIKGYFYKKIYGK